MKSLEGIDANLVRTIQYRTSMKVVPTICDHHLAAYGSTYFNQHVYRSKKCGDPFSSHKDKCPVGVKTISLDMCDMLVDKPGIANSLFPGFNVCVSCYSKLSLLKSQTEIYMSPKCADSSLEDLEAYMSSNDQDVFESLLHGVKIANKAAEVLGISPVTVKTKESHSKRMIKIQRKSDEIRDKFGQVHQQSLSSEVINIHPSSSCQTNVSVSDLETLMTELKVRCNALQLADDKPSIISLLTLAPASWSIAYTADFFNVSQSEVRRARILKQEKGVLAMPDKRNGRTIGDYEKAIVKEFYESDENSRMMPGMNDTVSVRIREGEKK